MNSTAKEGRRLEEKNTRTASSEGSQSRKRAKDIFLFSDGTGNSSGKLFKTNVWRLYEALDLGEPVDPDHRVQIAYYDNGVGTSGFKPLAVLGGIFGIGLKSSVLRLYMFLCRNYQPGDRIFAFGFSRGAFTIRLLVGLVALRGVLTYIDETELKYQTGRAWSRFRQAFELSSWPARHAQRFNRGVRRWFRHRRKDWFGEPAKPEKDKNVRLEFVGIWDTVAAYGGPIVEITRGIDKWICPLTLDDHKLSPKVQCARHALAIDDQRDAFQPLVWDEVNEADLVEKYEKTNGHEGVPRDRMKQVWFAGMHADVGGGYPDESLSYVSLVWMMDELKARCPDVRLIKPLEDRIRLMTNVYGPLHDSRSGVGAYYRFQPRKIAALIADAGNEDATQIYRDPQISPGRDKRGLIVEPVKVHHSVFDRIVAGTDGYAPINLPAKMELVPATGATPGQQAVHTFVAEQLAKPAYADIAELQEKLWDYVWVRRIIYFLTVLSTVILASVPWWDEFSAEGDRLFLDPLDDRTVTGFLAVPLKGLLPGFTHRWIDALAAHPVALWLIPLIGLLLFVTSKVSRAHCNRASALWRAAFLLPIHRQYGTTATSIFRSLRENWLYQRFFASLKWTILPNIVGLILLAAMPFLLFATMVQTGLALHTEPRRVFCDGVSPVSADSFSFKTTTPCQPLALKVKPGDSFTIRVAAKDWGVGSVSMKDPGGIKATKTGWRGILAAPFRRVVPAGYLEPLIVIHAGDGDVHIQRLNWSKTTGDGFSYWSATFKAGAKGELDFTTNAAILPHAENAVETVDWASGYRNNRGCAAISIQPSIAVTAMTPWPKKPDC